MNNFLFALLPSRRQFALGVASAFAIGALAVGIVHTAYASSEKPSVSVQVDSHTVNRGTLEPASYAKVAKRVAPSVVKITTETKGKTVQIDPREYFGLPDQFRQFFGQRGQMMRQPPQSGLGSGVIISADGFIATNNHVVDGADSVSVTLDDGRELKAKIVGRDPQTDIAVVKVDAKDLPAITFAESAQAEVGDRVLAVGNPFGLGETVTTGIVSAKGRRPGLGLAYEDFIQTDAAINPGNSGGALVDIEGRLIGINTAILSRSGGFQGVGLAVPSDIVRNVVDNLVAHGKVVRGYLGVTIQNIITPDLADSFGLKSRAGALVTDVKPGSPAAKAGLHSGDVITELDGKPVTDSSQLSLTISQKAPGTKLDLQVLRDGKSESYKVTTATQPSRTGAGDDEGTVLASNDDDQGVLNGVTVADIDGSSRRQMNIPGRIQGVLITDVAQDSAAARAGLQAGDVILEINSKPVHSADEAVKLSEDGSNKKTRLKLWSRGGMIYVVVDETKDNGGNS